VNSTNLITDISLDIVDVSIAGPDHRQIPGDLDGVLPERIPEERQQLGLDTGEGPVPHTGLVRTKEDIRRRRGGIAGHDTGRRHERQHRHD